MILGRMQPGDPNWGTAYPTITHRVWKTTGSTGIIERHLPRLARYLDSLWAGVNHTGQSPFRKHISPACASFTC